MRPRSVICERFDRMGRLDALRGHTVGGIRAELKFSIGDTGLNSAIPAASSIIFSFMA
jgi:hypothetical protein